MAKINVGELEKYGYMCSANLNVLLFICFVLGPTFNMQLLPYILILLSSVLLSLGANIEGSIMAPLDAPPDWAMHTRVRVDGGKFLGFVQRDGHFIVSNVPSGSYLIEFTHLAYLFQVNKVWARIHSSEIIWSVFMLRWISSLIGDQRLKKNVLIDFV